MFTNVLNTTKDDEVAKIVLIDSNALIHRSFHAIPHLTTQDGKLVNAVYGFAATILRVLEDLKPRYIVATFDVSKDTFRRKMYAQYKAQRIAAPQELYDQIPLVKEVCNVLNIPIFAVEGYEADDVIGTIVTKIKNLKFKIKNFIVTGDKDTYQLIDDDSYVYSIIKGLKNVEIIDTSHVREMYGFGPELIVDYKALRGDPSDNIPGVPGIGEVTAKKLIQNFQSIENLYSKLKTENEKLKITTKNSKPSKNNLLHATGYMLHDDSKKLPLENTRGKQATHSTSSGQASYKLSEKLCKLLLDNEEKAKLSKELSTIKLDVPLDFDLGCCLVNDYNKEKALKLFQKLEFKSLIPRLPDQHSRHEQVKLF